MAGANTVSVTDGGGCTEVFTFTVPALPTPSPTFTQQGNDLVAAQVWPAYQWVLNGTNIPGATASTYTIAQSGSYTLVVTDSNGCTGESPASTIVGLNEAMDPWAGLQLAPNPAHDQARINAPVAISEDLLLTVQDIFGRTCLATKLSGLAGEFRMDFRGWAAGPYVVTLSSADGGRRSWRLVLQ